MHLIIFFLMKLSLQCSCYSSNNVIKKLFTKLVVDYIWHGLCGFIAAMYLLLNCCTIMANLEDFSL